MVVLAPPLCYGPRGDAAFYVFAVSPGILILATCRRHLPKIGIASVLSVIGIRCILGSGQPDCITQSEALVTLRKRIKVAIMDTRCLPECFVGFTGLNSGPDWRDTPLSDYMTILDLLVLGAVLFYGARAMNPRKILATFIVFGVMAGILLLIATPSIFPNPGGYHFRYALLLLGTWLLIWLSCAIKKSSIARGQIVMFVFFLSVVDMVAMHTTIARYVRGLLSIRHMGRIASGNPNGDTQWWWVDIQLSPMALWDLASLGYAFALAGAICLLRNRQVEAPASTTPTKEGETA